MKGYYKFALFIVTILSNVGNMQCQFKRRFKFDIVTKTTLTTTSVISTTESTIQPTEGSAGHNTTESSLQHSASPSYNASDCVDQDDNCEKLASEGKCEGNTKEIMENSCRKSCNSCCVDQFDKCPKWASEGKCDKCKDIMESICRRSCNFCNSNRQTSPTTGHTTTTQTTTTTTQTTTTTTTSRAKEVGTIGYIGFGLWGEDGDWQHCPNNGRATSFIARVQVPRPHSPVRDDTSLNSFCLICEDGPRTQICSREGHEGDWFSHIGTCHGGFDAMKMRLDWRSTVQDTAAHEIQLRCRDTNVYESTHHACNFLFCKWDNWPGTHICPQGSWICGLKTRVHAPLGGGHFQKNKKYDDTGLNGVLFKCCR